MYAAEADAEAGPDDDEDNAANDDSLVTVAPEASDSAEGGPPLRAAGVLAPNGASDPLAHVRVADAMLTTPRLVRESDPIATARRLLDDRGAALMVVDDHGGLAGIVTRSDLRDCPDRDGARVVTVGDVAVRNLVTARSDELLAAAIRRMSRLGLRQLPVVDAPPPAPPRGLLRRADVLAAYERSLGSKTAG